MDGPLSPQAGSPAGPAGTRPTVAPGVPTLAPGVPTLPPRARERVAGWEGGKLEGLVTMDSQSLI